MCPAKSLLCYRVGPKLIPLIQEHAVASLEMHSQPFPLDEAHKTRNKGGDVLSKRWPGGGRTDQGQGTQDLIMGRDSRASCFFPSLPGCLSPRPVVGRGAGDVGVGSPGIELT